MNIIFNTSFSAWQKKPNFRMMLSKIKFLLLADKEKKTTTHVKYIKRFFFFTWKKSVQWGERWRTTAPVQHNYTAAPPLTRIQTPSLQEPEHTIQNVHQYLQWIPHTHECIYILTTYSVSASMPLSPSMSTSTSLERLPSTRVASSSRGTVKPSMPNKQPLKRDRRFSTLHCLQRV